MSATLFDHLEPRTAAAVARAEEVEEVEVQVGARVLQAVAQERAAQVNLLIAAADWANAHVYEKPTDAVPAGVPRFDHAMVLAGAGAPAVSDYAVSELGALMGVTFDTALALLGDAIELKHRLPRLWDLTTVTGTVTVGLARRISELTRDLSPDAAADADQRLCQSRRRIDRRRARLVIDEVRLWHDPDRALEDERADLARRDVQIYQRPAHHHTPAVCEGYLLLDALEGQRFLATVNRVAARLAELGDSDPIGVRRAKAVGVLADPQTALDLLNGAVDNFTARQVGPAPAAPAAASSAVLYLHVSDTAVLEDGPVTIERLGTVTKDRVRDWLTGSRVTIRPVLDMTRGTGTDPTHGSGGSEAVDVHDPPEWMREQVTQRDRHCVFPHCNRDARFCDLDHITPYIPPDQGGPPGQTHPHNLAPLCRRHHRAKTHGHFTYQRLPDGAYRWTLPTGHHTTATP